MILIEDFSLMTYYNIEISLLVHFNSKNIITCKNTVTSSESIFSRNDIFTATNKPMWYVLLVTSKQNH